MKNRDPIPFGAAFILSVLLSLSLAGCTTTGEVPKEACGLTRQQIEALGRRILENTPDHLHFEEGACFTWVCLTPDVYENPPAVIETVNAMLAGKYTLYPDRSAIPEKYLHYSEKNGEFLGYEEGFEFSFKVILEGDGTIKVKYHDFEGNAGASWHWERYEWSGDDWIIIEESDLELS